MNRIVRLECRDGSLHPRICPFFFEPPRKRVNIPRDCIPFPIFSCKHAVYICNVLFLSVRTECRDGSRTPSIIHSFSYRRKRTNQEKGGRPKLPFLWECLSWLNGRNSLRSNKTPIFNAMPSILIVRQSRPTSHSRNGAAWRQMQAITDTCMLENYLRFHETSDKIFLNKLWHI